MGARLMERFDGEDLPESDDVVDDAEPAGPSRRSMAATASNEERCYSCRGKKVDRFGFDCTTCFGSGKSNE